MEAIVLLMAHIMWFVGRGKHPDFSLEYRSGIGAAIWWAVVALVTGGYGDKPSSRVMGRLLALVWMVASIVLISIFTARITSDMTVQELNGSINSLADLQNKRVATVANSTSANYLEKFRIHLTEVAKIEEAYPLLARGEVDAVVYDAPVLRYYIMNEGRGQYKLAGAMFHEEDYGIALPSASPHREEINVALLGMIEDGTYKSIYEQWFGLE